MLPANCVAASPSGLEWFKIIPNPNNGIFTVKMKLNTANDVRFRLFNILGQAVYQSETYHINSVQLLGTISKEINVSWLAGGVYQLEIRIDNASLVRKIIISNH
jgi:hypothetical protein